MGLRAAYLVVRHANVAPVAAGAGHHGQANAGAADGALVHSAAWLQQPLPFRVHDDAERHPVLNRPPGLQELGFALAVPRSTAETGRGGGMSGDGANERRVGPEDRTRIRQPVALDRVRSSISGVLPMRPSNPTAGGASGRAGPSRGNVAGVSSVPRRLYRTTTPAAAVAAVAAAAAAAMARAAAVHGVQPRPPRALEEVRSAAMAVEVSQMPPGGSLARRPDHNCSPVDGQEL